jgi:hypothetical protein
MAHERFLIFLAMHQLGQQPLMQRNAVSSLGLALRKVWESNFRAAAPPKQELKFMAGWSPVGPICSDE